MKKVLMFHDVFDNDPNESGFRKPSSNAYKVSRKDFLHFLDAITTLFCNNGWSKSDLELTFDDGGVSFVWIAEELKKRGLVGHFFISTHYIGTEGFCTEEDIRTIDSLGQIVGSHSHTHPDRISAIPEVDIYKEWEKSTLILQNIVQHPIYEASIPGGSYSPQNGKVLHELRYNKIYTSAPTTNIKYIGDSAIIGRYTIMNDKNILTYIDYFKPFSLLMIKTTLKHNILGALKKILGKYYITIRSRIFKSKRQ